MFSVADAPMYLRIILNLEEMFMMWGGRDKLKFQQYDCHLVISLSECMGLPSGINYADLLFHFDEKNISRKRWKSSYFQNILKSN